jgi:hypothetical protein
VTTLYISFYYEHLYSSEFCVGIMLLRLLNLENVFARVYLLPFCQKTWFLEVICQGHWPCRHFSTEIIVFTPPPIKLIATIYGNWNVVDGGVKHVTHCFTTIICNWKRLLMWFQLRYVFFLYLNWIKKTNCNLQVHPR